MFTFHCLGSWAWVIKHSRRKLLFVLLLFKSCCVELSFQGTVRRCSGWPSQSGLLKAHCHKTSACRATELHASTSRCHGRGISINMHQEFVLPGQCGTHCRARCPRHSFVSHVGSCVYLATGTASAELSGFCNHFRAPTGRSKCISK